MASSADSINMALYCDFENVALGVRDANYDKFDISRVLERLLLKGNIVVKKAYCDWDRYKSFKASMHEANFELIEIPHLRQSGKNSADIRASCKRRTAWGVFCGGRQRRRVRAAISGMMRLPSQTS